MKRGSEPAYPCPHPSAPVEGMTIRERFVMAAMQGLCASGWKEPYPTALADKAICIADATLAALGKEG